VTISIAEVIEEAAQLAEGWDSGAPIAKDIRALAAQYEGCIVAEGKPVLFAVPWQSQDQSSLYRAKQPETCKPALQVERADARRGRWLLDKMRHQQCGPHEGWTLDRLYPGDDAAAAVDAAMDEERGDD